MCIRACMRASTNVHARNSRRKDGLSSVRYRTDKPTIHRSMDQERTANVDRMNRANHGAISLHLHLFGPSFPSFLSSPSLSLPLCSLSVLSFVSCLHLFGQMKRYNGMLHNAVRILRTSTISFQVNSTTAIRPDRVHFE